MTLTLEEWTAEYAAAEQKYKSDEAHYDLLEKDLAALKARYQTDPSPILLAEIQAISTEAAIAYEYVKRDRQTLAALLADAPPGATTTPLPPPPTPTGPPPPPTPTGAPQIGDGLASAWRNLVRVFQLGVPAAAAKVDSIGQTLKEAIW